MMLAGLPPTSRKAGALAGALVASVLLLTAPTALAHSALLGSSPADGDRLAAPPDRIVLRFSDPLVPRFVRVALLVGERAAPADLAVHGNRVLLRAPAAPPLADRATRWVVRYRVVSRDGHPIGGRISFRVSAGASPSPGSRSASPTRPATSATGTARAPTQMPETGERISPWLGFGVGVLGLATWVLVVVRRDRP